MAGKVHSFGHPDCNRDKIKLDCFECFQNAFLVIFNVLHVHKADRTMGNFFNKSMCFD